LLAVATDVGRHNTIDKLRGACALEGIDPRDRMIASTGRISSEMISKAAKMGVGIVLSRTSPTALAVGLARAWGATVIGYVRRGSFNVYAGAERVVPASAGGGGASSPR
jgi:FdhD protein